MRPRPREPRAPSWRSISPELGSPCMPMARPLSGKAMAPAKADGTSPGEVHDIALKVAETDATKRALATFGKPFGLELYRGGKTPQYPRSPCPHRLLSLACCHRACSPARRCPPLGFHPDDTTPIPRPSRYYGRRQDLVTGIGRRVAVNWKSGRQPAVRSLSQPHPASSQGKSTKAFSPSPSPSGYVTKPI